MTIKEKYITALIKAKINQKDSLAEVILFGSHARGQADSSLDWDILILLNQAVVNRNTQTEYCDELFYVELEIGESISSLVFSKTDWEERYSLTPLYHNIKRDGISL
jgi:predicted nucleotidyltransferase